MPKQVLLLQKNPARPEVMRLANGYDVFPTASIMGQFLHPPPSQGDYISSMRTLNKHTEPPFCHLRWWILPCDSHLPPIPPQSCPPLLVISISKLCTHLQTYLKLYLSILILYLPISVLVPPACPAYPLPPVLLLSATLQHTFYLEPADIPQHTYQWPNLHPTSMCYSLPPPFLIIFFCLLLLFLPLSVNHVFPKVPPSPHCDR